MKFLNLVLAGVLCFMVSGFTGQAMASDNAELLDILKENGTLTNEQYEKLMENQKSGCTECPEAQPDINITTEGGVEIATYDGKYSFELGGRLMLDAAFYDDGDTKLGDGTELRRARVELGGTLLNDWEYVFDVDFGGGDADIKDAFISFNKFWPAKIKAGNYKEPFSLENLTSSNNITFMERSLIDEFSPGRSIGIGADTSGESWSASIGFFGQEYNDDVDDEGDEGWGTAGRFTFAPIAEEKRTVHLGVAGNYRKIDDAGEIKYNPRPESHITDLEFADTDDIEDVDNVTSYGLECAGVFGPLSIQGEYVQAKVNRDHGLQGYEFGGYYIYGSWFVTGESRAYNVSSGKFGKIKPNTTTGAIEIALRYSGIDLTDKGITGGKEKNTTLGVNWYINSYVRVMANYIWVLNDGDADADGDAQGNDDPKIFQTRLQIAF